MGSVNVTLPDPWTVPPASDRWVTAAVIQGLQLILPGSIVPLCVDSAR
jgi:hypothetical protein